MDQPLHTHQCGHDCTCVEPGASLCDRCEIADVVLKRHALLGFSRGRALASLYLAMERSLSTLESAFGGEWRPGGP